jgi:flavin reductase (DIM6/NTAB) family NADH-FMN oxidoreductase RutF/rubredoxin
VGDAPPVVCPICNVGPEKFIAVEEEVPVIAAKPEKQWKCVVCEYIHVGDEPPEVCPVCGVGKENFVLLDSNMQGMLIQAIAEATEGTARASLEKLSYGLYVLTSINGSAINGQCVNTVFQLTSQPPRIAVCLNKNNVTHEFVIASGVFAVSVLGRDHFNKVAVFGYQSGRNVDKFAEVNYVKGQNGCPILSDCIAYLEAQILPDKMVDVGTHTLFVADVTSGSMATKDEPLTYAYYRANKPRTQR